MKRLPVTFLALLAFAPAAQAGTIVLDQGMTFTLTNNGIVNDGTLGSAYELVYTIDTNGWTGASGAYVSAVSIKPTSSNLTSSNSELVSTNATGTWTYSANQQANQGGGSGNCGGGGQGWACADEIIPGAPNALLGSATYTWTFRIQSNLALLLGLDSASIKAAYSTTECKTRNGVTTCSAKSAGNTSKEITIGSGSGGGGGDGGGGEGNTVPEPASLVLLGSGLALAAARMRRRGR